MIRSPSCLGMKPRTSDDERSTGLARYDTRVNLVDELLGLVESLNGAGVEYAVCGGIAVAIHGYPRFTKDIDLLIRASDLDRVRTAAKPRGFVLEGGRLCFGAGTQKEREVFRLSKADGPELLTLDLLLAGPALEEVWNSRQRVEWRGQRVWVVSRDGLVRMKRMAGRLQDLADVEHLLGSSQEGCHD